MQCLYVAGTMIECLFRRGGVCLWEVKNAMFVCGWDQALGFHGKDRFWYCVVTVPKNY